MSEKSVPHDHGTDISHVLQHMPGMDDFTQSAAIFQQLGDGSRLRILWLLCHCEECVNNIATAVDMSKAAVSHHLKSLRLHGLVKSRRDGKEIHYTLADGKKPRLVHQMVDDFFQLNCPSKGLHNHP